MARTKNVDDISAVAAAMAAFWETGFESLGTRDLEARTGITRFSLQKTHGGKEALYRKVLLAYLDQLDDVMIPAMQTGGLEGLAQWFERRSDVASNPPEGVFGCMMINAMVEFSGKDDFVRAQQTRYLTALQKSFSKTLGCAKAEGELPRNFLIAPHSALLTSATLGLNILVRAGGSFDAGQPWGGGIAEVIRSWRA